MDDILITFAGIAVLGLAGLAAWLVWKVVAAFFFGVSQTWADPDNTSNDQGDFPDGMNEGDYHSGPGGYEPNTAYPDTHYGDLGRDE